jgi:hypothetical protein
VATTKKFNSTAYKRTAEVYWAAGLFEGEGFISTTDKSHNIGIDMTDRDVLERFQRAVGLGVIYGPYNKGSSRKPMFAWRVGGRQDREHVLRLLYPLLSVRRQEAADRFLERHVMRRPMHRLVVGGVCRNGHPVTDDSLYVSAKTGGKTCKPCKKLGLL